MNEVKRNEWENEFGSFFFSLLIKPCVLFVRLIKREKEPNSSLHLIHFFRSYFVLFIHFIRASIPLTLFLSLQWSEMKWSEMEWKEEEKSGMRRTNEVEWKEHALTSLLSVHLFLFITLRSLLIFPLETSVM